MGGGKENFFFSFLPHGILTIGLQRWSALSVSHSKRQVIEWDGRARKMFSSLNLSVTTCTEQWRSSVLSTVIRSTKRGRNPSSPFEIRGSNPLMNHSATRESMGGVLSIQGMIASFERPAVPRLFGRVNTCSKPKEETYAHSTHKDTRDTEQKDPQ